MSIIGLMFRSTASRCIFTITRKLTLINIPSVKVAAGQPHSDWCLPYSGPFLFPNTCRFTFSLAEKASIMPKSTTLLPITMHQKTWAVAQLDTCDSFGFCRERLILDIVFMDRHWDRPVREAVKISAQTRLSIGVQLTRDNQGLCRWGQRLVLSSCQSPLFRVVEPAARSSALPHAARLVRQSFRPDEVVWFLVACRELPIMPSMLWLLSCWWLFVIPIGDIVERELMRKKVYGVESNSEQLS